MSEDFPEIKIPFWMDGKHTRTLARGFPPLVGRGGGLGALPAQTA